MSLFVSSLNSGSNGNCYYIGDGEHAVLIDGGISCRETEKRMKRAGLSIKSVKAIFVTHEHGDHIHGVPGLIKRHKLPVYVSEGTNVSFDLDYSSFFEAYKPVKVGNLSITGFPKCHDASDPHSFIVSNGSVTVGVFTDIGAPCKHVTSHFSQCHAAFLEANYDTDMLDRGSYPWHLKMRIKGGKGHLSNHEALSLFVNHRPSFMSHLFLAHLSRDNNSPTLVHKIFSKEAGGTSIIVASRDRETPVYHIRDNFERVPTRELSRLAMAPQLSIF